MTTTLIPPKCVDGLCAWRGCQRDAISLWFTMRLPSTADQRDRLVQVRFCSECRKRVVPGCIGLPAAAGSREGLRVGWHHGKREVAA